MKLRVVGWTYYEEDWPQSQGTWAERYAIIDEIKKHGYNFSGWSHQEALNCAPVLNDGTICCYSQRGWGDIMAEAHGFTGFMDYAKFAFLVDTDKEVRPKSGIKQGSFVPETDLNERFELTVTQDLIATAKKAGEIVLDNLPQLHYLDSGDTLALVCGNTTEEFVVVDVNRKRDLTEERRLDLMVAMRDYHNKEKQKEATEEFNNTKVILVVKLKGKNL